MRFLAAAVICIGFLSSAEAQRPESFSPYMSFTLGASSKKPVKDIGKPFQDDQANIGFGFPLYFRDFEDNQFGHSRFLKIFLTSQSGLFLPVADSVKQYYMLHSSVTLTGIYHSGNKNTYFYSLNNTFYGDAASVGTRVFYRPTAFIAYRHSFDARWAFQMGIAYTYAFGDGTPLPLAGFSYIFKNRSRLNFVAPLSLSYVYSPMSRIFLKFHLGPHGTIQSYRSKSDNPALANAFQVMRLKQGKIQADIFYKTYGNLVFNLGLGILFKRSINFPDLSGAENRYLQQNNGLYIGLGLRYVFGTSFKQEIDYEDYFLGSELSN